MSSPITWADVTSLPGGAQLSTVPVGGQNMILNSVNTQLNVNMFDGEDGPQTKLVRAFFAAHLAALGTLGTGGILIAESIQGLLSRQYSVPFNGAMLQSTSFGRALETLLNMSAARLPIVLT